MEDKPILFGILGCANIARKVSRAILLSPNTTLQAIASRSIEKATLFASENYFPSNAKVYGSYQEVLDDADVDAVYVPLPTSMHLKWAVLAAEKKKHVLLEKPVALSVGELDEILKACESNGVQYMDSTMWMHHPRTEKMREFLNDPKRFGKIKSIHSIFSYNPGPSFLQDDIRVKPDLDALGCLGDTGWYCIRAILWANDYELPNTAIALPNSEFNESGVLLSCGASLSWFDKRVATFYCTFLSNLTMDVTCVGTEGYLRLHDFVIPFGERSALFYTASESRFKELSIGCEPVPIEHLVETELPQETSSGVWGLRISGWKSVGRPSWSLMLLWRRSKMDLSLLLLGVEPIPVSCFKFFYNSVEKSAKNDGGRIHLAFIWSESSPLAYLYVVMASVACT